MCDRRERVVGFGEPRMVLLIQPPERLSRKLFLFHLFYCQLSILYLPAWRVPSVLFLVPSLHDPPEVCVDACVLASLLLPDEVGGVDDGIIVIFFTLGQVLAVPDPCLQDG